MACSKLMTVVLAASHLMSSKPRLAGRPQKDSTVGAALVFMQGSEYHHAPGSVAASVQ